MDLCFLIRASFVALAIFVAGAARAQEFELPADATILRTYQAKDIEWMSPHKFDLGYDPNYFPGIAPVRDAVTQGLGSRPAPQVVFAPAMGSDAGTLAYLAPQARVFVGVDANPAAIAHDVKVGPLVYSQASGKDWRLVDYERSDPFRLERMVGALHEAVPGFRPLEVTVFQTPANPITGTPTGTHVIIRFDSGAGTPVRQFVRLQGKVEDGLSGTTGKPAWWVEELDRLRPDMVVVKGAMDSLHPVMTKSARMRAHVLGWLTGKGVLIEDYSLNFQGQRAVSGDKPFPSVHYGDVNRVPFGYSKDVMVPGDSAARIHFFGPHHTIGPQCGPVCDCVEQGIHGASTGERPVHWVIN